MAALDYPQDAAVTVEVRMAGLGLHTLRPVLRVETDSHLLAVDTPTARHRYPWRAVAYYTIHDDGQHR
jgi:hypothetical protein